MIAIWGVLDGVSVYEWIARASSAVALWASMRVAKANDPLAETRELTYRLRHPVKHALLHPLSTVTRIAKRTLVSR